MLKLTKLISFSLTFVLFFNFSQLFGNNNAERENIYLSDSKQLIVVLAKNWETHQAKLQRYEKIKDRWIKKGSVIEVVLGKKGLAWGIGLHDNAEKKLLKKEGDFKTPAGIFHIDRVFTKQKEIIKDCKMNCELITEFIEAVDDSKSKYYNQIVDIATVKKDWKSSERMFKIDLYDIVINIAHNIPVQNIKGGSCIFIHKWRNKNKGTAGCIAMDKKDLKSVFLWLDKKLNPIILQVPIQEYKKLVNKTNLSNLPKI